MKTEKKLGYTTMFAIVLDKNIGRMKVLEKNQVNNPLYSKKMRDDGFLFLKKMIPKYIFHFFFLIV